MDANLVEVRGLCKNFPGVAALRDVDVDIRDKTVHCIVGENGAGKSTFIKILTGAEGKSSGEIRFGGQDYTPRSIRDAMDLRVSALFQELNVVNSLTVEENLTLGRERTSWGVIRRPDSRDRVFRLFREFAPDIPLQRRVSRLSYAEKQVLEIVKAVAVDATLIIMDEPTAALSEHEARRLFEVIRGLRERGITTIYISHILDDIFAIGDSVTVFRDGRVIGTHEVGRITKEDLIRMMVGTIVTEGYVPRDIGEAREMLRASDICTEKLRHVSFDLRKGEVIGFYGLRGSGKSEIARVLYGLDPLDSGQITVRGKQMRFSMPRDSMRAGLAMVPEERLAEGLVLEFPVRPNISITNMKKISRTWVIDSRKERAVAESYVNLLNIRAKSVEQRVGTLSGGNQQKVVFSKCLNVDSAVLMLDEPTRGIDVGAKEEIHRIIRQLAKEGASIMVFSSEYPEIASLCDRIFLLADGEVVTVLQNGEAGAEEVMRIITKGKRRQEAP